MFPQQGSGMNRPPQVASSLPSNSIQGIPGMPPSAMMPSVGPSVGFGMQHNFPGSISMTVQPNQNKGWPQAQQHTFKQQDVQSQQALQQSQNQKDHKHRDYLKQQQRLKAMPLSSSKGMSADALIGNLLEKKDTFTPRQSVPIQGKQPGDRPEVRQLAQPGPILNRVPVGTISSNDNLPGWLIPSSSRLPPIYSHIWSLVGDPASGGTLVDTNKILALLLTSGLPKEVLGFIWNLATDGANVQLNQQQLYITLALVALAQMGCTFNNLSVFNFIPTPPIPTFNMNVAKSNTDDKLKRSESLTKSSVPLVAAPPSSTSSSASAVVPPLLAQTTCLPTLNQSEDDDFADDFTDFQSADTSHVPPSSNLCTTLPATAVIQPSANAKQVVNELNHSVVNKLGCSHGRSIGSRLANHTLGAPKLSANQRHRRASADSDNVYIQEDLGFNFEKHQIHVQDGRGPLKCQENEDFSDFQVAAGLNVNVDELFPKCHPKPKPQDFFLKESAIRNESDDEDVGKRKEGELLSLDSPPSSKPTVVEFKSLPAQIEIPLVVPPPLAKTTKELMSVEEDRYSALRLIEVESSKTSVTTDLMETTKSSDTDDFGDFVSADDMFSEIAVRDTGTTIKQTNFPSSNNLPPSSVQNAEFPVDDWGDSVFQSSQPTQQPSLLESGVPTEAKSRYDDLSFAFSDLNISQKHSNLSKVDPPSKWGFDFDVGKESPSLNLTSSFNDINQNDDDFGDFVGSKSTQIDETNCKISSGFLSDPLWSESGSSKPVPGTLSDNRSVSSLELSGVTLSRHGSLPSLDLNLFPTTDDMSEKVLNSQLTDWMRCLESSCSLLQAAASTFTNIATHSVLLEVLGTAEGKMYLNNLMEVHRVTWRIQRSYQRSGHESNQVDSILVSVSNVWSTLQTFYKLANIETAVEKDGSDEESGQPGCGVCGSPASRGVLEYGGNVYHAPCANLWLNCVDRTLPTHSPLL